MWMRDYESKFRLIEEEEDEMDLRNAKTCYVCNK